MESLNHYRILIESGKTEALEIPAARSRTALDGALLPYECIVLTR